MFPLSSSERALQNEEFKKGYKKCCDIIDSFSKNDPVMGHIGPECFELFFNSMAENDLPEAAANIIWLLFLNWSQIIDKNMIDALISIIYPRRNKPAANKVILKERSNVSDEVIRKQKEFVEDLDDMAMELIKLLKAKHEWADLADYYLGMKYLLGMVDTGLSTEMNAAVGMQMLLSQVQLGNKYSLNTLKALTSL